MALHVCNILGKNDNNKWCDKISINAFTIGNIAELCTIKLKGKYGTF